MVHPRILRSGVSVRVVASLVAALAIALSASSCSSDPEEEEAGTPTGSTCPPSSTLTYDSFAKPFMEKYCTGCHSSALSGAARHSAPAGHDFDSEAGILAVGEHVDEHAAAGPNAVNTSMPPLDPRPTEAERRQLGEWLACAMHGDGG